MKKLTMVMLLLLVAGAFFTCKKSHKPAEEEIKPDTLFEPNALVSAALEREPSLTVDLNDVVLPNGSRLFDFELQNDRDWLVANKKLLPAKYLTTLETSLKVQATVAPVLGPQAAKNIILSRAQIEGNFLVTRSNFNDLVKNKVEPQQTGLAYIYGSRDYTLLTRSSGQCPEMLFGLDCSGMLMDMMAKSGIILNTKTETSQSLSQTGPWIKALKAAGAGFEKIEVQRYSSTDVPLKDIISGDIIFFYGWDSSHKIHSVQHIGIALTNPSGKLMLYQSNGRKDEDCYKNYAGTRGPRTIGVSDPITQSGWGFDDYGVIRLTASISGTWKGFMRCKTATIDAITINSITFPPVQNGTLGDNVKGSGTDYNGKPVDAVINGTYDAKKNFLSGTITYTFPQNPTEKRSDSFSIDLGYDDTGYKDLTKVIDNGGCYGQLRLVNQQTAKVNSIVPPLTTNTVKAADCHCSLSGLQ